MIKLCLQPCRETQTLSCPQGSHDNQDSSLCFSTQSQPAPVTKTESPHYDGGIVHDKLCSPCNWSQQEASPEAKPVPRKAGRPVTFLGDINSPSLSTSDRCRIKRRIVNREAARRLRERRQDTLDGAQAKVSELKQRNKQLQVDLLKRRARRRELQGQVQEAQGQWKDAAADHAQLQAEVHRVRRSLEASLLMIEESSPPSQPCFSGRAPYMSPISPFQGHSPAESALSHEVLQPSHLATLAPSLTARESLPSQWTSGLAGQFHQGTLGSPGLSASRMGSSCSSSCKTGSAGGSATLRDLIINQSCKEVASGGYKFNVGSAFSPSASARPTAQLPSRAGRHSNTTQPSQVQQPPSPHITHPLFWHDTLDSFASS